MAPAGQPSRVSSLEHTLIGAGGGMTEVVVMQPMMAIKNALQEGRPIPRHPRELYRGLLINMGSMAPITATQFGTNRLMESAMSKYNGGGELSSLGRFGCAAVAGGVSALIGSPTELIIIQQQKKGTSLRSEISGFFKTYRPNAIYRGLAPCIARETLYAGGYLGVYPILYDKLQGHPKLKEYPSGLPTIVAGLIGGIFAAGASQPFDTIKTRMQAHMYSRPEYATVAKTVASIYKEGGIRLFWRGLAPRMFRIVGATFLLIEFRAQAVRHLEGTSKPLDPLEVLPLPSGPERLRWKDMPPSFEPDNVVPWPWQTDANTNASTPAAGSPGSTAAGTSSMYFSQPWMSFLAYIGLGLAVACVIVALCVCCGVAKLHRARRQSGTPAPDRPPDAVPNIGSGSSSSNAVDKGPAKPMEVLLVMQPSGNETCLAVRSLSYPTDEKGALEKPDSILEIAGAAETFGHSREGASTSTSMQAQNTEQHDIEMGALAGDGSSQGEALQQGASASATYHVS